MKLIATTAAAVLAACLTVSILVVSAMPSLAHGESTMNEDNELFERCTYIEGVEICDIKREHMVCEPAEKYNRSWREFVEQNGLSEPQYQGKVNHKTLGPVGYISIRMDEHYGHTYVYIVLEDVVCLGSIAHFLDDPA